MLLFGNKKVEKERGYKSRYHQEIFKGFTKDFRITERSVGHSVGITYNTAPLQITTLRRRRSTETSVHPSSSSQNKSHHLPITEQTPDPELHVKGRARLFGFGVLITMIMSFDSFE